MTSRSSLEWRGRALLALVLVALTLALPGRALAEPPSDGRTPTNTVSAETKAQRAKLDSFKAQLDQKEAALQRADLPDADLAALRQQIDPLAEAIRGLIADLTPRIDAAKARLGELGPKPAEDAEESEDVVREREAREAAAGELDETRRLARTILVQAEQLTAQVSDRRRASFARSLFERTSGILSPALWSSVAHNLPRDLRALGIVSGDWLERIRRESTPGVLLVLGLAIGIAVALYIGRAHLAPRLIGRDPAAVEVPRRRRLLVALGVLVLGTLPALAGSALVYFILDATRMIPPRFQPLMATALGGLAFVAFVQALADALLAPGRGAWRLVRAGDASAGRIVRFAVAISAIIVLGKIVEALNTAIAAALLTTVASRSLFALAAAAALALLLRRFASVEEDEEASLGPYIPAEPQAGGSIRVAGWIAVVVIGLATLVGYVALASFLVDQLVWLSLVVALAWFAIAFADEFVGGTLRGENRIATAIQANTGLRRRSLQQIGVLAAGLLRVVLILAALMLVLAPWGVESVDVLSSVKAAFFGLKVGDVTISLSSVAIGLLIFATAFTATRIVQSWLEKTFLPATELDAGLRNSILTVFGYVGFFVAAAFAFSYLGLSLDKIAIVAGALSVGVGFGLQSIVNNFVSGLILLWERPIRVGDLVVVGDGEGYVRRINVRATEIETYDRATVIVPNSNLISGVVRNRVRVDRTGRVVLPVTVPRSADPVQVTELLMAASAAHPDVLKDVPPKVFFKKIGEADLTFELICIVADVDRQARVQSDLNFAVFEALTKAGLIVLPATPQIDVRGLTPVERALDHIAEALGEGRLGERRPRPAAAE